MGIKNYLDFIKMVLEWTRCFLKWKELYFPKIGWDNSNMNMIQSDFLREKNTFLNASYKFNGLV